MIHGILSDSLVYHYTSENGLMGILGKDKITLHFTKADSVNDINEGIDIINHVVTAVNNLKTAGKITNIEFDEIMNNLSFPYAPSIYRFDKDNDNKLISYGCMPSEPYIMCFSESNDSLPMWNYYCTRGNLGYALEIDIEALYRKINDELSNCKIDLTVDFIEYSVKNKINFLTGQIDQCINSNIFGKTRMDRIYSQLKYLINEKRYLFKDSSFAYEKEVRAIISVPQANKSFLSDHLKFKTRNGYIIPYIEIQIDSNFKDILKSITIGPLANNELAEQNLKLYLKHYGYSELAQKIKSSKVPIRF